MLSPDLYGCLGPSTSQAEPLADPVAWANMGLLESSFGGTPKAVAETSTMYSQEAHFSDPISVSDPAPFSSIFHYADSHQDALAGPSGELGHAGYYATMDEHRADSYLPHR